MKNKFIIFVLSILLLFSFVNGARATDTITSNLCKGITWGNYKFKSGGIYSERICKNGMETGEFFTYIKKGFLHNQIISERKNKDGLSYFRQYYLNGNLKSEAINDKHGSPKKKHKSYYENGNLKSLGDYENYPKRHVKYYYDNKGNLKDKIEFENRVRIIYDKDNNSMPLYNMDDNGCAVNNPSVYISLDRKTTKDGYNIYHEEKCENNKATKEQLTYYKIDGIRHVLSDSKIGAEGYLNQVDYYENGSVKLKRYFKLHSGKNIRTQKLKTGKSYEYYKDGKLKKVIDYDKNYPFGVVVEEY